MVLACWFGADTIKSINQAPGCNRMPPQKNGGIPTFRGCLQSHVEAWEGANGARGRSRTADTVIFSHVLYQLSYPGIAVAEGRQGSSARWKRAYGEGTGPCPVL